MAENRLRDLDVERVDLIGRNLRELTWKEHKVHRWVSLKGGSEESPVQREFKGLWIWSKSQKATPIQRGEVSTA
jgi:hypothetical protein